MLGEESTLKLTPAEPYELHMLKKGSTSSGLVGGMETHQIQSM